MIAQVYSDTKLPADAMPAVFALSMFRKLRYLYDGQYFRFSNAGAEFDYPMFTPSEGDKIVKIYDQKSHSLYSAFDATQSDPSKQPEVEMVDGVPSAKFSMGQFLEIGKPYGNNIQVQPRVTSADLTFTFKGSAQEQRPMFGCWNKYSNGTVRNIISIEPAGRCSIYNEVEVEVEGYDPDTNPYGGSEIIKSFNFIASKGSPDQFRNHVDSAQGHKRVIEMRNGSAHEVQNLDEQSIYNLGYNYFLIGKSLWKKDKPNFQGGPIPYSEKEYQGNFDEITLHENLTKIGSNKIWKGIKDV